MKFEQLSFEEAREIVMKACFFYYQLLEEGEFAHGQTSFWLFDDISCWELLNFTVVEPNGVSWGIDEEFIREAALIYLLCILFNDCEELGEKEFLNAKNAFSSKLGNMISLNSPQYVLIKNCIGTNSSDTFKSSLKLIFDEYVRGRFNKLSTAIR